MVAREMGRNRQLGMVPWVRRRRSSQARQTNLRPAGLRSHRGPCRRRARAPHRRGDHCDAVGRGPSGTRHRRHVPRCRHSIADDARDVRAARRERQRQPAAGGRDRGPVAAKRGRVEQHRRRIRHRPVGAGDGRRRLHRPRAVPAGRPPAAGVARAARSRRKQSVRRARTPADNVPRRETEDRDRGHPRRSHGSRASSAACGRMSSSTPRRTNTCR